MKKGLNTLAIIAAALLLFALVIGFQYFKNEMILPARISLFTTRFLGIFIEAIPFLMLGALISGIVEVFFSKDQLRALVPKHPALAAMFGGIMGLFFPVCECGVVPLTRRLYKKGLPPSVGIAFILSSPIINPIVIASTLTAYGWSKMLWMRIGFAMMISMGAGMLFALQKYPGRIVRLDVLLENQGDGAVCFAPVHTHKPPLSVRLRDVLKITSDEFFEMGRFLIIGAGLAALMQTFIPQSTLLELGGGPVSSVLVMIVLAVVLSICSTVDAFVSLAFIGSFTGGSVLAFLLFGPMVDIKSTLMFLQVFQKRTVVYIILLPMLLTMLITVTLNYYFPF